MSRRRAILAGALLALTAAPAAHGASIGDRTLRVSLGVNGTEGNGDARHAAISGDGHFAAFDSDATNLALDPDGAVRDVFLRDLDGNVTDLVSRATGGAPADGPSTYPTLSGDGRAVAFVSGATNLVAGDSNGVDDIFVRAGGRISRVSVAADGGQADGPSQEPDISEDGRYIAFSSDATNLVPGDTNGMADVFVKDRFTGAIRAVSRSSHGRLQNDSVASPFVQVSDVSRGGRFVTFDSDATNLVRGDTNRSTDVFVRDVRRGRTGRASVDERRRQGDNDSFYPTISANGSYVAFESFANNLSRHDGPGEDLFLFDLSNQSTILIDVGSNGARKRRESIRQLLQRPAIANSGHRAAFSSTSGNLTPGDDNAHQDVFARILAPPQARIAMAGSVGQGARFRVRADDPAAHDFRCQVDATLIRCGRLPLLRPGRHELKVYAGGAGMLFQARPARRRFTVR